MTTLTNRQGLTPAQMSYAAEQQMRDNTMIQSLSSPNTLVTGGQLGAYQTGQQQTPMTYQAYTYNGKPSADTQAWIDQEKARQAVEEENMRRLRWDPTNSGVTPQPTSGIRTVTNPNGSYSTIGQAYGSSGSLDDAQNAVWQSIQSDLQPYNEQDIRTKTLNRFQAEIDALDRFYAEQKRSKLAAEVPQAEERVGENIALQAARGTSGSTFGTAQNEKVRLYNKNIEDNIIRLSDTEALAARMELMGKARETADKEIETRRNALKQAQKEAVEWLNTQKTANDSAVQSKLGLYILANQEPTDQDIKDLATKYGKTDADVKLVFNALKAQKILEKAKEYKEISEGQTLVDPTTGAVIYKAPEKPGTVPTSYQEWSLAGKPGTYESWLEEKGEPSAPSSYKEWQLAGSPGTYTEWVRNTPARQSQNYIAITTKYQADPIVTQGDQGAVISQIADQVIANPNSAANQMKALYGFIKSLDPNSAVREGEVALAQTTQSYLDRLNTTLQRVTAGQTISPQAALELAQGTKELAKAWSDASDRKTRKYLAQAEVAGIGDDFRQYLQLSGVQIPETTPQVVMKPVTIQDVENSISATMTPVNRKAAEDLIQARPDLSLEQILQVMGFKSVPSKTENGSISKGVDLGRLVASIGEFETGSDYNKLGPRQKSGNYAVGKYQVMASNVPSWTKEVLGYSLTPAQFRSDKVAQDKVATAKLGQYLNQYGTIADAASKWFTGQPASVGRTRKDSIGTSGDKYIRNIQAIYDRMT